ncbi:hypothetical protein GCM10010145_42100 [Streptomyces ruber]|uniref:Uncharacterized protein n=2 Tax=Streptomyces TaxID=1883 RepID=A0A918BH25_9ACTN|nr:hypothetical protein [Streptomyces ruber]GGQ67803.1 hypothetical protein GCM10010145_42100 [Streptomyces ruber]
MGIRTLRCRTATTLGFLLPAGHGPMSAYAPDASTARVPAESAPLRSARDQARAAAATREAADSRAAARP